jgi:iron complex transport system ATP-binding protein
MSAIAATDLVVRRGGRNILDGVSLFVEGCSFVALIGANGAGKSTLLNCLAGLLKPDGGEITLDGIALHHWKQKDLARTRAFVPQNPRCEWPITVERLVALGLTPTLPTFGSLGADVEDRVATAIAACDLTEHAQQTATTLSGGELARAMLARALVGEPATLIVDEPTAGLDPRHAIDAMARLKSLAWNGRLVIASVHDLTLAARYADTLIAMKEGRIVAHGPIREVLTPKLIREVFAVEAELSSTEHGPTIDLHTPA